MAQTIEQEAGGFSLSAVFGRVWDAIKAPFQKGDLSNNFTAAHNNTPLEPTTPEATNRFKPTTAKRDEEAVAGVVIADSDAVQTFAVDLPEPIVATNLLDTEEYGAIEPSNKFDPQALAMQTKLKALGYDLEQGHEFANDGVDGYYGKVTIAAVEQFQLDNDLDVTGIANGETLALMQEKFEALPPESKVEYAANTNDGGFIKASYNEASLTNASVLNDQQIVANLLGGEGYRRLSSDYGPRTHPITGEVGKMHKGVDIAATEGTPIVSPADGTIVSMRESKSYGNVMEIDHGNGLRTLYAHLKDLPDDLAVGQKIAAGETVAEVGNTGWSTGAHLHFELKVNGQQVNPDLLRNYLPDTGSAKPAMLYADASPSLDSTAPSPVG